MLSSTRVTFKTIPKWSSLGKNNTGIVRKMYCEEYPSWDIVLIFYYSDGTKYCIRLSDVYIRVYRFITLMHLFYFC